MAQISIVFLSSIFKMFISTWSQMFKMIVFEFRCKGNQFAKCEYHIDEN